MTEIIQFSVEVADLLLLEGHLRRLRNLEDWNQDWTAGLREETLDCLEK